MAESSVTGSILICEDDRNIAALVETYLAREGFRTVVAYDGQKGLEYARTVEPTLIILDWMLPGIDGAEICRQVRKTSDVPILMLTAREEETDRIVGFSLGVDDYVVKPFSPRELVERVKAILRRAGRGPTEHTVLRHGALALDPDKRKVMVDGESVALTPSEYTILITLMRHPGRVFSRDELLSKLYTRGESVVDRVIDVHVGKLRQKIEPDSSKPAIILTVHGVGYRFAERGEE